jgi:hypothetical protein
MAPNIMFVGYDAVVLARQRLKDEWFDVAPEMTIGVTNGDTIQSMRLGGSAPNRVRRDDNSSAARL